MAKGLSHGDRVELNVNSENLLSEREEIFESWRRCLLDYRVDARDVSAPHIITQNELKVFREPLENIVVQAQEEIDRLYAVLRQRGYVVLLCNREGVAIHHRGDEAKAGEFKHWGIWVGGVWSVASPHDSQTTCNGEALFHDSRATRGAREDRHAPASVDEGGASGLAGGAVAKFSDFPRPGGAGSNSHSNPQPGQPSAVSRGNRKDH